LRILETGLGRRRHVQQLGGVHHHVLRRRRLVVGDVVDVLRTAPVDAGENRRRDVVDVDAVEHLPRLDDAMRGAFTQPVDGAAPWPIDTGEAEHLRARATLSTERQPILLGVDAPPAAGGGRVRRHRLVDPGAPAVAVDAHRRQVADPTQRWRLGEVVRVVAQHRIAVRIRRRRDEHVCCLR
jgi:hypothetical protein